MGIMLITDLTLALSKLIQCQHLSKADLGLLTNNQKTTVLLSNLQVFITDPDQILSFTDINNTVWKKIGYYSRADNSLLFNFSRLMNKDMRDRIYTVYKTWD